MSNALQAWWIEVCNHVHTLQDTSQIHFRCAVVIYLLENFYLFLRIFDEKEQFFLISFTFSENTFWASNRVYGQLCTQNYHKLQLNQWTKSLRYKCLFDVKEFLEDYSIKCHFFRNFYYRLKFLLNWIRSCVNRKRRLCK